ncbi:MAG: hypothetical protein OEZ15_01065, partial [Gammaproteobacteria bacterium]|nr:hypothetical protein [Gammaproteobacteria bacterium]
MASAHHHRARPVKRHWLKKISIAIALLLLPVVSGLLWLVGTESGLHWIYQQANAYLPTSLTIEKIEGRLAGPLTLSGIRYQQDGVELESEQVIIDWQPTALFTAYIDISQLHLQSLKIILPTSEKANQAITLPDIHLPWRLAINNAVIENISITRAGEMTNIRQIKLDASVLFSRIDIKSFGLVMDNFELNVSGNLNPVKQYKHELNIDWQSRLPGSAMLSGKGLLQGDITDLKLQQQITGAIQVSMNVEVRDVTGKLNWRADAEISDFDSARVDTTWPEIKGQCQLQAEGDLSKAELNGSAEGYYAMSPFDASFKLQRQADNSVYIEQLIFHSAPSETRLDVTGNWTPGDDGGHAVLDLHWQNLRWPLDSGTWFDTASGSGRIEGNLQHYHFDLTTDRPWPQAPASTWYANADGNLKGLDNFNLRITALDGEATSHGRLNWLPALTWQAETQFSNINPGVLWPQWPANLQAMVNSTGSNETGGLIIELDIPSLTGELRGNTVSLQSHLRWQNENIDISHFELQSGNSQISAHGHIGSELALNWKINTDNLAELYPYAKGKLSAEGAFNGTMAMPSIEASFNGEAMAMPGYSIGKINGEIDIDLRNWNKLDVVLDAGNLKFDNYTMHSLQISADTENLHAQAVTDNNTVIVELAGNSRPSGWQGQILKADILSSRFNDWLLLRPTDFSIDKNSISLDTPCWQSGDGQLCLSLKRIQEQWRTQLTMDQVSLMVFSYWLPPELIFEGHINATAELEIFDNQQFKGSAQIELPPGAVSYPLVEGEREHWQYNGGQTDIKLNIQGLQASTEFSMSNGDGFNATLKLPDFNLLAYDSHTQSVEASAKLSVHNLGFIE